MNTNIRSQTAEALTIAAPKKSPNEIAIVYKVEI
jgi:hypothetical protein